MRSLFTLGKLEKKKTPLFQCCKHCASGYAPDRLRQSTRKNLGQVAADCCLSNQCSHQSVKAEFSDCIPRGCGAVLSRLSPILMAESREDGEGKALDDEPMI